MLRIFLVIHTNIVHALMEKMVEVLVFILKNLYLIKLGQSWHFKLMILNLWLLSLIKISFLARKTLLYVFSTDLLSRLRNCLMGN